MPLTRRRFFTACGATAAVTPFIPALEVYGQSSLPPRILILTMPHYESTYGWAPEGEGTPFTLNEVMEPLALHRDRLLVVTGLENTAGEGEEGTSLVELHDHVTASFGVFTGLRAVKGPNRGSTTGSSFDQIIASRSGGETRYRSLQLGVEAGSFSISHSAAASPLPMDNDPASVFDRLFSNLEPETSEPSPSAVRRVLERRSVLDFVGQNLALVRGQVGRADQNRIDAHLARVRELEQGLSNPQSISACDLPNAPTGGTTEQVGPQQVDLAVAALACDLTRVASVQFGGHGGLDAFSWVGNNEGWHYYAHRAGGRNRGSNSDAMIRASRWVVEQLARALDRLSAVDVGDGTLLDHTLVAFIAPPGHGTGSTQYLLAGGERLGLATGRHLAVPGGRSNEMMLSILHRMGLTDLTTFGNPDHCEGPIAGV